MKYITYLLQLDQNSRFVCWLINLCYQANLDTLKNHCIQFQFRACAVQHPVHWLSLYCKGKWLLNDFFLIARHVITTSALSMTCLMQTTGLVVAMFLNEKGINDIIYATFRLLLFSCPFFCSYDGLHEYSQLLLIRASTIGLCLQRTVCWRDQLNNNNWMPNEWPMKGFSFWKIQLLLKKYTFLLWFQKFRFSNIFYSQD